MSIRTSLVAASLMVLASATPALANDHLMKVGEVMLANSGGSPLVQFIELEDPGESFPAPPYIVEIFSAAGGSPLMTYATTLGNATATRYMLATPQAATAFGFTAQTTLTQTLPVNGQACFKQMAALTRIHCFAWGTITNIVPAGTMNNGASPPNGMSVQRVNNTYVVAAPTPNAANSNGTPMVDAPPMVDGPPIDAPSATPDAPGNPVTPGDDDDGCSVRSGASWFGFVLFAVLLLVRRTSTQRKR